MSSDWRSRDYSEPRAVHDAFARWSYLQHRERHRERILLAQLLTIFTAAAALAGLLVYRLLA